MGVEVRNLRITLGNAPIVRGVDFSIGQGGRVGLIGPSGSGKSMIAKALLGLLPSGARVAGGIAMEGVILAGSSADWTTGGGHADGSSDHPVPTLADDDDGLLLAPGYAVSDRWMAGLRGRYVGTVFQNPAAALNPTATVGQQVALPLKRHFRLSRAERRERVERMLAKVGLDPADVMRRYPGQLSGGQQQRVGIATALVAAPRLIIADEPTTALDAVTQRQIVDLLVSLVDDAGASLLFITHDFSVLARATTRCLVLDRGRVVESGPTARLLAEPREPLTRRLVTAARTLTLGASPGGMDDTTDFGGGAA
ncbi:ABC transporter ATP-binding protein [Bifidobacterium pullorum subsp. saeculare]|uniref:ABC transporter ATP-binding protein n=1 Tax=Bifidobacterium pullorum subsp. saeculare TaxID=78257 RepID=A0A939B7D9_9BIFI|nr:ABC transporter ATP-binding protein [Bifidobacterium pullorum]MBM6698777.1 ABC transporter ATP-binding protein [Bifidobacterium pullorum subsp. saeculare]